VAEVVPVSSSAQLVLLPWLLGWEQPDDRTGFAAVLHAGSCAGLTWALRDDLRRLPPRELAVLAGGSLPAAVAGLLLADAVEERCGRPAQLAALLAGFGALLWVVDERAPGPPHAQPGVDGRAAALASLAQVTALVPGVSRSGATLVALRAAGVDRAAAQRFSLLLSLPVTAGAAALSLARLRRLPPGALPGGVTAAVAAAVAAQRLRRGPDRPLRGAALYRLALAAVVARRLRHRKDDR
jgi:undecaprenyl-diphosphatase